jgi:hypothetical protein
MGCRYGATSRWALTQVNSSAVYSARSSRTAVYGAEPMPEPRGALGSAQRSYPITYTSATVRWRERGARGETIAPQSPSSIAAGSVRAMNSPSA